MCSFVTLLPLHVGAQLIDQLARNHAAHFLWTAAGRWLAVRLDWVATGIVVCVARPVFVRLLNFAPFGSRNIASFCSGVILRDPLRRTSDMLSLRVSPLTGVMNACCDGGLWSACPTPVRAVVLPNRSWRESVWVNRVLTSVNNDIWFCSPDSSRWSRTVQ